MRREFEKLRKQYDDEINYLDSQTASLRQQITDQIASIVADVNLSTQPQLNDDYQPGSSDANSVAAVDTNLQLELEIASRRNDLSALQDLNRDLIDLNELFLDVARIVEVN